MQRHDALGCEQEVLISVYTLQWVRSLLVLTLFALVTGTRTDHSIVGRHGRLLEHPVSPPGSQKSLVLLMLFVSEPSLSIP
jgi:hypothetical protein